MPCPAFSFTEERTEAGWLDQNGTYKYSEEVMEPSSYLAAFDTLVGPSADQQRATEELWFQLDATCTLLLLETRWVLNVDAGGCCWPLKESSGAKIPIESQGWAALCSIQARLRSPLAEETKGWAAFQSWAGPVALYQMSQLWISQAIPCVGFQGHWEGRSLIQGGTDGALRGCRNTREVEAVNRIPSIVTHPNLACLQVTASHIQPWALQ